MYTKLEQNEYVKGFLVKLAHERIQILLTLKDRIKVTLIQYLLVKNKELIGTITDSVIHMSLTVLILIGDKTNFYRLKCHTVNNVIYRMYKISPPIY